MAEKLAPLILRRVALARALSDFARTSAGEIILAFGLNTTDPFVR
jgi:hypothetical protein